MFKKTIIFGIAPLVVVRHIIPPKTITYNSYKSLSDKRITDDDDPAIILNVYKKNLLLFDSVNIWYDTKSKCFPMFYFYLRRVNIIVNYI